MDQIKIGKFIAGRRKDAGLTQMQLAEALGITDRAVSKWENGRSLPDSSIMIELCGILGVSVNDLLCGEVTEMTSYDKKTEENLIEMIKEKERADKRLLTVEVYLGVLVTVIFLIAVLAAAYVEMETWLRITIGVAGSLILFTGADLALRIEQTAGYYKCAKCGHRYVPKYGAVFIAMHVGRTRYMKCPCCGKRSWQKKVLGMKDE